MIPAPCPAPATPGNKIIAHICNDIGGWGKGFVLALSRRWPQPESAFRQWYKDRHQNNFALGNTQLVQVEPTLWVANMIAQQGLHKVKNLPPIHYDAVESALTHLATQSKPLNATIHMPRTGCGLAGGKWEEIEPIIQRTLCAQGINVLVYDLA